MITRERLEKISSWREKYGDDHNVMLTAAEAEEMARRLMAVEDIEPDNFVVVTTKGVWQRFCHTRAEAEFHASRPFNKGYTVLEIYTRAPDVQSVLHVPDGYCAMPLRLTAANGAKGALSGEFHVTLQNVCQSCGGEGCEDCNDEGNWDSEIAIGWDTIKRIHEAAVEACALPIGVKQERKH